MPIHVLEQMNDKDIVLFENAFFTAPLCSQTQSFLARLHWSILHSRYCSKMSNEPSHLHLEKSCPTLSHRRSHIRLHRHWSRANPLAMPSCSASHLIRLFASQKWKKYIYVASPNFLHVVRVLDEEHSFIYYLWRKLNEPAKDSFSASWVLLFHTPSLPNCNSF